MTPEAIQSRREKRRQKNIKAVARYNAEVAVLQSTGMSCSNCALYGSRPVGERRRTCDLKSDFHGYVLVDPNYVCPDHQSRVRKQKSQERMTVGAARELFASNFRKSE